MKDWIVGFVMQNAFAGKRRIIAVILLGAALLVDKVICDPALSGAVPALANTCSTMGPYLVTLLGLVGGWTGLTGIVGAKQQSAVAPDKS